MCCAKGMVFKQLSLGLSKEIRDFGSKMAGQSSRARGLGFPPTTIDVHGPRLLSWENGRKIETKEIPSCLIPHLLVVFTRQLENVVTALK